MLRIWSYPLLLLIGALPWAAARLFLRAPVWRTIVESVFAGYLGAMIYIVFLLHVRADETVSFMDSVNVLPGRTIILIVRNLHGQVAWQVIGNVMLFVPLGLLLPTLFDRCRRFLVTAFIGLLASAGIELVQLILLLSLVSRRSVDIDDVILNVAGACLGYLIWKASRLGRSRDLA